MSDPTEDIRRGLQKEINAVEGSREFLAAQHGQVWDTQELQADFSVQGFMAPFVGVVRKSEGAKGSMAFQHAPRFYFSFQADA